MTPREAPGYDRYDAESRRLICWNCSASRRGGPRPLQWRGWIPGELRARENYGGFYLRNYPTDQLGCFAESDGGRWVFILFLGMLLF